MSEKKHEHDVPPGYLGASPEQADPHDHRKTRPMTTEPPLHTHPNFINGLKGMIERGDFDAIAAELEKQPWLGPPLEHEPRWYEIATEGLPPENEQVLVWTYDSVSVARRDDIGWLGEEDQVVSKVTHWHPLPAPPTRAR